MVCNFPEGADLAARGEFCVSARKLAFWLLFCAERGFHNRRLRVSRAEISQRAVLAW
jgi:hypothetical protein